MKTLRCRRIVWSEKQEQRACVRLYETLGGAVYALSQPRATMQAEGLPDLLVFLPVGVTGLRSSSQVWHEVKRVGGKLSPAQERFAEHCRRSHQRHVVGGLAEAMGLCTELGLIAEVGRG